MYHSKFAKPWHEIHYDDLMTIKKFPHYHTDKKFESFTGGKFQLKKAKAMVDTFVTKHKMRKNERINKAALRLNQSVTTVGTTAGNNVKVQF